MNVKESRSRLYAGPKRLPNADDFRLFLGVNNVDDNLFWNFINQTLLLIGGKAGMGKTQAVHEWLCQLAVYPWVQIVILDGKEGHTYRAWKDRAWLMSTRDLKEAVRTLKAVSRYIQARADAYYEEFGLYNIWDARPDGTGGPTVKYPLMVVIWEEAQVFLSQVVSKEFNDRARDLLVAQIFDVALNIVNAGRDFGILNWMITQYAKADAIPSLLTNQMGCGACMGVITTHAAASILTQQILVPEAREFSPVGKIGDHDKGVATVLVPRENGVPFDRVRVPYASGAHIRKIVKESASYRRDPFTLLVGNNLPE